MKEDQSASAFSTMSMVELERLCEHQAELTEENRQGLYQELVTREAFELAYGLYPDEEEVPQFAELSKEEIRAWVSQQLEKGVARENIWLEFKAQSYDVAELMESAGKEEFDFDEYVYENQEKAKVGGEDEIKCHLVAEMDIGEEDAKEVYENYEKRARSFIQLGLWLVVFGVVLSVRSVLYNSVIELSVVGLLICAVGIYFLATGTRRRG